MLRLLLEISLFTIALSVNRGNVCIIGGSGRVGKACASILQSQGYNLNILIRQSKDIDSISSYLQNEKQNSNTEKDRGSTTSNCNFIIGDVLNVDSLIQATKNCDYVLDVHGMKPPRFSKFSDLYKDPKSDITHPYNVNYVGVQNVIKAMKINNVSKIVRITGATVGKSPFSPFRALFSLLLSMTGKYHELSEKCIRESGLDYSVLRPTGIVSEPSAKETNRRLVLRHGDDNLPVKIPAKISVCDLAELIVLSMTNEKFKKGTGICSSEENKDNRPFESWTELIYKNEMRLVLHLDINKTILISDPAGGVSFTEMLNSIVSESVMGKVRDASIPLSERSMHDWIPLDPNQPIATDSISFGEYIECHTTISREERKRLKMKGRFTEAGYPGHDFASLYHGLSECLKLPIEKDEKWDTFIPIESDGPAIDIVEQLPHFLSTGYYQVIPSFFYAIDSLLGRDDIDLRLIFRTFGTDGYKVAEEFNMYCEGRHPFFKPQQLMDGSPPLSKDYRLNLPYDTAKFIRTGPGDKDAVFTFVGPSQTIESMRGATKAFEYINGKFRGTESYSLIVSDDFTYWQQSSESDESGKLFLVHPHHEHIAHEGERGPKTKNREMDPPTQIDIFFDDNIERDRAHIVDVRDIRTFSPIPFHLSNSIYIRRVQPTLAIQQKDYFVREIDEVIKKYFD